MICPHGWTFFHLLVLLTINYVVTLVFHKNSKQTVDTNMASSLRRLNKASATRFWIEVEAELGGDHHLPLKERVPLTLRGAAASDR
jgi:hypothetical protein